jgi:hypothetical protein
MEGFVVDAGEGWTSGASMPLGRGGMGKCVCVNGLCYVFGGEVAKSVRPSPAKKISSTRTIFSLDIYNIQSNSWSQGPVRCNISCCHSCFVV